MSETKSFVTAEDIVIPKGTVLTKDEGAETISAAVGNAKVTFNLESPEDMANVTEAPAAEGSEAAPAPEGEKTEGNEQQ